MGAIAKSKPKAVPRWTYKAIQAMPFLALSSDKKPKLSARLVRAIKTEVMDMINSKDEHGYKHICTARQMAGNLGGNNAIRKSYADAGGQSRMGSLFSMPQKYKLILDRKYQLADAFGRIESKEGAGDNVVDSWEKAEKVLAEEFEFPTEEERQTESFNFENLTLHQRDNIDSPLSSFPSEQKWIQITGHSAPKKLGDRKDEENDELDKEVEARRAERDALQSKLADVVEQRQKEAEAKALASNLMRGYTLHEQNLIEEALWGSGPSNEVLQSEGSDTVLRASMQKLRPAQWLNDEVIHFFYVMLAKRDEEMCKEDPNRKRSHFFKSFFITKLLNEGHADPSKDG